MPSTSKILPVRSAAPNVVCVLPRPAACPAEFLTSISASYAKAKAGQGDPEEVDLLRATAVIELIAGKQIAEQARGLQKQVTDVHKKLRKRDSAAEQAEQAEVPKTDRARGELIKLFKADLDIPADRDNGQEAGRAGVSGQPSAVQPR